MRMVLVEMDGVRVRGGMIEDEEGGGRGAVEGEGEEGDGDEETMIGGMGTDMVVMSDAIAVLFGCFSFPPQYVFYSASRHERATTGLTLRRMTFPAVLEKWRFRTECE